LPARTWPTSRLESHRSRGCHRYLDTDYAAKGRAAIKALKDNVADFIVVHVEATDEASHEGKADEKVRALEQIDRHIVGPLHEYLRSQGEYRLLICPDIRRFSAPDHSHGTFHSQCVAQE